MAKTSRRKPRQAQRPKSKGSYIGLIAVLVLVVIAFFGYKAWFGLIHPGANTNTIDGITKMSFNGRVNSFDFDDSKNEHIKIAVLSDGTRYQIYPDWVYLVDVGDTLIKERDSLKIQIHKYNHKKDFLDYEPMIRRYQITGHF
jgi:hypothetical protein